MSRNTDSNNLRIAAKTASRAGAVRRIFRRLTASLLALGIIVALLAGVGAWGRYQYGHLVSRQASVRGHVAELGARIDGVVVRVEVDAGDSVTKGQVLARLDDRHLHAELERARSELERTTQQAVVERLAIEQERRRLEAEHTEATARAESSTARLEAAVSRAENANREYERISELLAQGATSSEEVRDAESRARTAEALVAAAEAARDAARAAELTAGLEQEGLSVREAGLAVLDARVDTARAAGAVAQANLEAAVIRAPDDGRVIRRIVEPGGSVKVGQPILALWSGDELWVEAWIDEANLSQVDIGSPVNVTVQSFPDRTLTGRVESIGVLTDREMPAWHAHDSRYARVRDLAVVNVRVALDGPPDGLLPGLSAVVGIPKKQPGLLPAWLTHSEETVPVLAASP